MTKMFRSFIHKHLFIWGFGDVITCNLRFINATHLYPENITRIEQRVPVELLNVPRIMHHGSNTETKRIIHEHRLIFNNLIQFIIILFCCYHILKQLS